MPNASNRTSVTLPIRSRRTASNPIARKVPAACAICKPSSGWRRRQVTAIPGTTSNSRVSSAIRGGSDWSGASGFLQGLRIQLHLQAGRREDRLLFDYQAALAERLGFKATASKLASEQLMQEYYRTAKAITQLNTILLQNIGTAIFPSPEQAPQPINERFQSTRQLLEATDEKVFFETPGAILEAFSLMQEHPELKGMTAQTIRSLWQCAPADRRRLPPQSRKPGAFHRTVQAAARACCTNSGA